MANYILPVATETTLGGVKIGEGIDITQDGVISIKDYNTISNSLEVLGNDVLQGKTLVANAITGKGVETSPTDSFQQMSENISNISTQEQGTVTDSFVISNITDSKISFFSRVELGINLNVNLLDFQFPITNVEKENKTNFSIYGNFSDFEFSASAILKSKPGFLFDKNLRSISTIKRNIGWSLVPIMQSNSQDGYIASCSDFIDDKRVAYKAFDGKIDTNGNEWHSDGSSFPHWLQIELPVYRVLQKIIITNRDISNDYTDFNLRLNPKNVDVLASNDGESFITLASVTCTNTGSAEKNEFNVETIDSYRYYRFKFNDNNANLTNNYVAVGELTLIGY